MRFKDWLLFSPLLIWLFMLWYIPALWEPTPRVISAGYTRPFIWIGSIAQLAAYGIWWQATRMSSEQPVEALLLRLTAITLSLGFIHIGWQQG